MDCSPPCSSVHGILQARILEWVAISFSRGSSRSGNHIWSIFRDVQLPLLASDQCLESFSFSYSILRKTAFFSETAQDAEHFLKLLSREYGTQAFQKFVSDAPWRWRPKGTSPVWWLTWETKVVRELFQNIFQGLSSDELLWFLLTTVGVYVRGRLDSTP